MKKLLLLLFVVFLFSCEKQSVDCWVCKVDSISMINGEIVGTNTTFTTPCGISAKDIFEYEKARTKTTVIDRVQAGLYSIDNVIVSTSVECKRK